MPSPKIEFARLIGVLIAHRVEFVGGVAAVLQGAPLATFDLDIVHRRSPENIDRLLVALHALGARYRTPGREDREPDAATLGTTGHQLLMTTAGPLDLLGAIGNDRGYEDLVTTSGTFRLSEGVEFRALDLPTLIRTKEEAGREKDRAGLLLLRTVLEQTERR